MKTKMMIATLVSMVMGPLTVNAAEHRVAAAGSLHALVRPAAERKTAPAYAGIERMRDSFRDGSHGRSR